MKYNIPEVGDIEINTIVLDLNGTLTINGKIIDGVKERLEKLTELGIHTILFTGDHRKNAAILSQELGIECQIAKSQKEKEELFLQLDTEKTAAIGNARIDIGTFKHAKIAIATLQSEGIHTKILNHVDIIVPSINDALDLFINKQSLEATMRA